MGMWNKVPYIGRGRAAPVLGVKHAAHGVEVDAGAQVHRSPEVDDLQRPIAGHQHILGLDVPVDCAECLQPEAIWSGPQT